MQTKIKSIILFWIFTLLCVFRISVFAQNQNESQNGDINNSKECSACSVTPDSLTRYISFMRSMLDALQSDRSIDIAKLEGADQAARANALTNENKNTLEEYMGIFAREGRYIGGQIQGATRDGLLGISRDFIGNFAREAVVGVRSSALVRDLSKLEVLDESIDREAISHINHFARKKPLTSTQIEKLNTVFGSYEQLFVSGKIVTGATYKDIVIRASVTNRKIKNHITYTPSNDFGLSTYAGINYELRSERINDMKSDYSCVKQVLGLNCNQTYGKTAGLRKEFSKSAGNELEQTFKKFEYSIKRLKNFRNGGIEQRGLYFNGRKLGSTTDTKNTYDLTKNKKEEFKNNKLLIKEAFDQCASKAENTYYEQNEDNYNFFSIDNGKITCREGVNKEIVNLENITKAEELKVRKLISSMEGAMDNVLAINGEEGDLNKLGSPTDTTLHFPLLSMNVYNTKKTVEELTKLSIESCLSFCSNLNAKVNCTSN